ncbi:MAG: SIMPL domain-containing protein [Candidatus Cloacimonas sp.]
MTTILLILICLAIVLGIAWLIFAKDKMIPRTWGIVGLSFIIGLTVFGYFFMQSRQAPSSLRVVGYASKLFESDLVKWNLTMQRNASIDGLKEGYTKMSSDVTAFKNYLLAQGIPEKDISIQPINSFQTNDNYGNPTGYSLNQNVFVVSSDVAKIEGLALKPDFFAERGILLQNSNLAYLYTKLPELKKQLLSEATKDAVARAQEIAGSGKTKLGKLREARAGVFQITEPYSTEVADYGIYNTTTKSKSISVTLTAIFKLM